MPRTNCFWLQCGGGEVLWPFSSRECVATLCKSFLSATFTGCAPPNEVFVLVISQLGQMILFHQSLRVLFCLLCGPSSCCSHRLTLQLHVHRTSRPLIHTRALSTRRLHRSKYQIHEYKHQGIGFTIGIGIKLYFMRMDQKYSNMN